MTLELLAVPSSLAHIQGIRLCPAGCLGGVRPVEEFEQIVGSGLERVTGPECPECHGTGIDPSCYEGCCDDEGHATIVIGGGGGFRPG